MATNEDAVDGVRVARVVRALAIGEQDPRLSLCAAAAALVGVRAAGVVLMTGGQVLGNVCVSNALAEAAEEIQYTVGEGPGVDACDTKRPVLVPDVGRIDPTRWSGFQGGALEAGVRAAFGFPLLIGTICVGALDLYHDWPGSLTREQEADAEAAARVVGRTVLGWQATAGDATVAWQLERVPEHQAAVHQASGMVAVQAGVSVDDALAMVRAYAFAESRRITDVVADVLERRLRFDPDGSGPGR